MIAIHSYIKKVPEKVTKTVPFRNYKSVYSFVYQNIRSKDLNSFIEHMRDEIHSDMYRKVYDEAPTL